MLLSKLENDNYAACSSKFIGNFVRIHAWILEQNQLYYGRSLWVDSRDRHFLRIVHQYSSNRWTFDRTPHRIYICQIRKVPLHSARFADHYCRNRNAVSLKYLDVHWRKIGSSYWKWYFWLRKSTLHRRMLSSASS
jgi:hypothetical protein